MDLPTQTGYADASVLLVGSPGFLEAAQWQRPGAMLVLQGDFPTAYSQSASARLAPDG